MIHRLFMALMLWMTSGLLSVALAGSSVTVFAAASLKEALDDVAEQFEAETGTNISLSFAGSSALARQIQFGAPAQVFLSANAAWMDVLQDQDLLVPDTRVDLLANELVLIAGVESGITLSFGKDMDLAAALNDGRLAMALVDAVPAGIYGRMALQSLGIWDQVKGRIAQTDNVRSALRLVAVGEAPLGIVYATDAAAEPRVQVLDVFPANSHKPILYPMARLAADDTPSAQAFYDYLTGPEARVVFRHNGFGIPEGIDE